MISDGVRERGYQAWVDELRERIRQLEAEVQRLRRQVSN